MTATDNTADLAGVYSGIRILDFTQLEQGPSGTQVLADFGAEVIKIERPDIGEIGRDHSPKIAGFSPHWAANNRNKHSLSINLKDPDAREVLTRLVESADVVASNFRPGVMDRLGLGHEALTAINPRIISAYASGYGQHGPYRERRGQDLAAQAMGGVMALTGTPEAPSAIGTFAIDYLGAMHFAQGIMLALAARERTGRGQVVDSCLLNSAVALHLQEATTYLNTGRLYPRAPRGVAHSHNTALYGQYEAGDEKWFVMVAEYFLDRPWAKVCDALGMTEHRDDPRFQTLDGLAAHVDETYGLISAAVSTMSREHAMKVLEAEDVLVAPVHDYPDLFEDPQVLHNEMVLETEHPDVGEIKLVGMPVKLSDTPGTLRHPPPSVGQDNERLLRELGYDDDRVAAMRATGAVGSENLDREADGVTRW